MNTLSLRERLLARKAEIEDALRELDRIEQLVRGDTLVTASATEPLDIAETKSIAQSVFEELHGKQLTVEQLASRLKLTGAQVKNALTGHRLRRIAKPVRVGGVTRYTILEGASQDENDATNSDNASLTNGERIISLLVGSPDRVWRAREVAETLQDSVDSTADNFHASIAATLSNLVKAGRIAKAAGGYKAIAGETSGS